MGEYHIAYVCDECGETHDSRRDAETCCPDQEEIVMDTFAQQLHHARQYGTIEEVLKLVDQFIWDKTGRIVTLPSAKPHVQGDSDG